MRFPKTQRQNKYKTPSKRRNTWHVSLPVKLFLVPSSVFVSKQFKELPEFMVSMCYNFDKIHNITWKEIQAVLIVSWTHNTSSEIGSLSVLAVSRDDF